MLISLYARLCLQAFVLLNGNNTSVYQMFASSV